MTIFFWQNIFVFIKTLSLVKKSDFIVKKFKKGFFRNKFMSDMDMVYENQRPLLLRNHTSNSLNLGMKINLKKLFIQRIGEDERSNIFIKKTF